MRVGVMHAVSLALVVPHAVFTTPADELHRCRMGPLLAAQILDRSDVRFRKAHDLDFRIQFRLLISLDDGFYRGGGPPRQSPKLAR